MNRAGICVALAAVLTTAAGCGGLTTKSFCEQFTKDVLHKYAGCLGAPSDAESDVGVLLGYDGAGVCQQMEAAVAGGRATYDAGKAQSCLDYFQGLSCADLRTQEGGPCTEVVVGKAGNGKSCYSDYDCVANAMCDGSPRTACPGKCHVFVAQGGDCSSPDAYCAFGTNCDGTTCQPDPQQGAGCDMNTGGYCGPKLYCKTTGQATTGSCEPFEKAGASCTGAGDCQFGLACTNGTCQSAPRVGSSCSVDADCPILAYCGSGVCTEYPHLGGTCGSVGQSLVGCIDSYCEIADPTNNTGICTNYLPAGHACDPHAYDPGCGPKATCNATTNVCTANPGLYCHEP